MVTNSIRRIVDWRQAVRDGDVAGSIWSGRGKGDHLKNQHQRVNPDKIAVACGNLFGAASGEDIQEPRGRDHQGREPQDRDEDPDRAGRLCVRGAARRSVDGLGGAGRPSGRPVFVWGGHDEDSSERQPARCRASHCATHGGGGDGAGRRRVGPARFDLVVYVGVPAFGSRGVPASDRELVEVVREVVRRLGREEA